MIPIQVETKSAIAMLGPILSMAAQDESTFDRCDQLYRAVWRGEKVMLASEFDECELDNLQWAVKKTLAESRGILQPNIDNMSEGDADRLSEYYFKMIEAIEVTAIQPDDKIVCLCNYKGEGEGYALLASVAHLPVYRSKSDSAMRFCV